MNRATENQTLAALFSVLDKGQTLEFIYRGGTSGGRKTFSFQIRCKARSPIKDNAEAELKVLKRNMEMVLTTRPGLLFGKAETEVTDSALLQFNQCSVLNPQGMLVSSGQSLESLDSKKVPEAVGISPLIPRFISKINLVDAILASPCLVEVAVSIKKRTLTEKDKQTLKKILKAIDLTKASYFMLPDRRKAIDEEREILIEPLIQHLQYWLMNNQGIDLNCVVYSNQPPSEVFMCLVGKVLYPQRKVTFTSKKEDSTISDTFEGNGMLDLRYSINAFGIVPQLFPEAEQLVDLGNIKRYYAPPQEYFEEGLCIGVAGNREVCLTKADRNRHVYIIGATGSGKSTLLYNMVMQDIIAGEGVCLMDPHGDLYQEILASIPTCRVEDVVLINPYDLDYSVGINFLETSGIHRQVEMGFIVNEILMIFNRLYDMRVAGGPVFEQYMRNALLLIMDNNFPGTLMDVARVFEDANFRQFLKSICKNPLVCNFWHKQAERANGDASLTNIAPYITSKLNQFTHNPLLRPIFGQSKSTINFRRIMDEKRILLVNLSKGLLGEMDCQLLGMILIGKLFLAAMGRADVDKAQRPPFYWYIDELQNFVTDSIVQLLSESRKYGICLTLANQNMAQLRQINGNMDIREALLGNVANLLMFRMGINDAHQMETYTYPELNRQDLQYLPDFHVAARLLKNNIPLKSFVLQTLPKQEGLLDGVTVPEVKAKIQANCRIKYARPVEDVEAEIFARAQLPEAQAHKHNHKSMIEPNKDTLVNNSSDPMLLIYKIPDKSRNGLQNLPINRLALNPLVKKGLDKMGIRTVWQLCSSTENRLLASPYLEQSAVDEIICFLTQNGLTLALRI